MYKKELVKEYTKEKQFRTAIYIRLSREDGDKMESYSVQNQRTLLERYVNENTDIVFYKEYVDDGWTGTNFERPQFQQMKNDIEQGLIDCILVKDLSRLGRNSWETNYYMDEYFPSKKVRIIALTDGVDKSFNTIDTSMNMNIMIKNMMNAYYPQDISNKVRSTFRAKQREGQFIGSFACYGYRKDPINKGKLIIDEYAASIVRRIFQMYLSGIMQNTIAKILNEENILCPSMYKQQCGLKYHNGNRLEATTYWTYSSVRRILTDEVYIGNMVQNTSFRQVSKRKAFKLPKEEWIIVENTHEPIIDRETWDRVQNLLARNTKPTKLGMNNHVFAGFIRCGDCERAMVKIRRATGTWFNCGSYNRYGKNSNCTIHSVKMQELEDIVLKDLNAIIKSLQDLEEKIQSEQQMNLEHERRLLGDVSHFEAELNKYHQKKMKAYADYNEGLISKNDYLSFKENCENQEKALQQKIQTVQNAVNNQSLQSNEWIEKLLQRGYIDKLDREIVVDMIDMIYVYEDNVIKIIYNFSDELEALLGTTEEEKEQVPS